MAGGERLKTGSEALTKSWIYLSTEYIPHRRPAEAKPVSARSDRCRGKLGYKPASYRYRFGNVPLSSQMKKAID